MIVDQTHFKIFYGSHINSQAVDYFLALPQNKDLAKYKLSSEDWDKLRDIEFVLSVRHSHHPTEIRHMVNALLSGSTPSTANNVRRNYPIIIWCHTGI
jgi:hypothetical protein